MISKGKKRPERPLGENTMGVVLDTVGKLIAGYLQKEVPGYEPFTSSDPEHLRGVIEPGDAAALLARSGDSTASEMGTT